MNAELKFPVKFEIALRAICGGEHRPDRYRLFREWWADNLRRIHERCPDTPLGDNADAAIGMLKREGVDESWFNMISAGITTFRAERLRNARRKAANARWHRLKKA